MERSRDIKNLFSGQNLKGKSVGLPVKVYGVGPSDVVPILAMVDGEVRVVKVLANVERRNFF